jgi:hypothetical protein
MYVGYTIISYDYHTTAPQFIVYRYYYYCTINSGSANLIRLASIGGVSILSVAINVILFIVVIVQCICISKKTTTTTSNGIGGYQGGNSRRGGYISFKNSGKHSTGKIRGAEFRWVGRVPMGAY